MQSIPTLFSSSLTVFPDCLLNHTLGLYFICPLSGLASGCRRVSWMLSLVCCLQSLLQGLCFSSGTSYPLVLCHCSLHRPWQTSLSQEALEFNSGSPQLPYCTVKSSSITYLAMENNLLPPLLCFSVICDYRFWKSALIAKGLYHLREGRKHPLQCCLSFVHFDSFFAEYTVAPQDPMWWIEVW